MKPRCRKLLRWLTPGIGIKRWILLAFLGLLTVNGGVIAITYALLREIRRHQSNFPLIFIGILLILLGGYLLAFGSRRVIREVARALHPRPPSLLDAFYRQRTLRGPKIVAIGGGTGLATLLRGLKHYSDNITAIVAVTDNGGSSGRLRAELGVLPPGDIRHCLTALAGEEELMTKLFNYRFQGGTTLLGHSFGNLFLTAMAEITGDLEKAIHASSRVLAVRGQVLPATLMPMELVAELVDGSEVRGESQISQSSTRIRSIRGVPEDPPALPEALRAISEADIIIIGPGSLYTSLAPHLLIPEIREALLRSRAERLYVCNVMTQSGETDHYAVSDHVRALQDLGGSQLIHQALVNQDPPQKLLEKYREQGQHPVQCDEEVCLELGVPLIKASLLKEGDLLRHDPDALARAIVEWLLTARRASGDKILTFPAEAELSARTKGWL